MSNLRLVSIGTVSTFSVLNIVLNSQDRNEKKDFEEFLLTLDAQRLKGPSTSIAQAIFTPLSPLKFPELKSPPSAFGLDSPKVLRSLFEAEPPTAREVDTVIGTVSQDQVALSQIFQGRGQEEFSGNYRENVFNLVSHVLTNEKLLNDTFENYVLAEEEEKRKLKFGDHADLHSSVLCAQSLQWKDLAQEYPCAFCLDTLAAPTILPCSHSFCGSCLDDHMNTCTSTDVEVVRNCPLCRSEYNAMTFESILDRDILNKVEAITDLSEEDLVSKDLWVERRNKFLERKKSSELGSRSPKTAASSSSSSSSSSTAEGEDGDDDDMAFVVDSVLVTTVAIAVLTLIAFCRLKTRGGV